MGRRPMSPEQQAARGNPGKRAPRKSRAKATIVKATLSRPTWLTDTMARRIWKRLQEGETAIHFLRGTDVHMFGRYCIYMAGWIEANTQITTTGGAVYETSSAHVENMKRINPWFVVRSRLEDDLVKHEEKLGLTPLDRQRILVHLAAAAQNPLGDLFGGQGGTSDDGDEGGEIGPAPSAGPEINVIGGLSNRLN